MSDQCSWYYLSSEPVKVPKVGVPCNSAGKVEVIFVSLQWLLNELGEIIQRNEVMCDNLRGFDDLD